MAAAGAAPDVIEAEVEEWKTVLAAKPDAAALVAKLSAVLAARTYLAGYAFSGADVAAYAAVKDSGLLEAASADVHVKRWLDLCAAALAAPAAEGGKAAGKGKGGKGKPEGAAAGGGEKKEKGAGNAGGGGDSGALPELEGAVEGAVVTRFPPEPSGYLHIGHVKAVLLNDFYARHYKGRLIIRFDDTNPSKEKDEFEQNIIADLASLGVVGNFVSHTSDYFDLLADEARRMIREGKAFMDDTLQEQMRAERAECKDSRWREASVEDNLARFEEMYKGTPEGVRWCMRAKINMKDPNGTLRDPVLFRANDTPHHRTGSKYKAYPTYDFACPLIDSLEGVTHALRTNEYHDRDAQYAWIQDALSLRKVVIHEFSRLNFVFTLLSKRKLNWFVESKTVEGWFDPRFPTVQGVLRRGCVLPALREFILSQGASKRVLDMEWDKFWAINKKHIDPAAKRFTAIDAAKHVVVTVTGEGVPGGFEARAIAAHPKNAELGSKAVFFGPRILLEAEDVALMAEGEEVTLMKWGNAFIRGIEKNAEGVPVRATAVLNLAGDVKKTDKKVTWISVPEDAPAAEGGAGAAAGGGAEAAAPLAPSPVPLVLLDFDFLITVPKLEEGDDFLAAVNKDSLFETRAMGEPSMRTLGKGDIIQLERRGYYRVDEPAMGAERPAKLFSIPDGRQRTTGVAAAYAATQAKARAEAEAAKAAAKAEAEAAKAAKKAAKAAAAPAAAPAAGAS